MEALMNLLVAIGVYAGTQADRIWEKAMDGFFVAFLVVVVGTPILAHMGWNALIIVEMLLFVVVWVGVTFNLKHQAAIAGLSLAYGVPAKGDAGDYAKVVLGTLYKVLFVTLVWAEIYMALYFHFPSLAKEWWMIGSGIALTLVISLTVIYGIANGKIADGPWHRPIIAASVALIAVICISAVPHTVWTSVGINPIWLASSQTATSAQELREKSWKNLDLKNKEEMKGLRSKVEKGEVLTKEEYAKLRELEQKVQEEIPSTPQTRAGQLAEKVPTQYLWVGAIGAGVVLVAFVFGKSGLRKVIWIAVIGGGVWYMYQSGVFEGIQITNSEPEATTTYNDRNFITPKDWGHIAAKLQDGTAATDVAPFEIIQGTHNGKRPLFGFIGNGGPQPTLIIVVNPDNDGKDIILENKFVSCQDQFADESIGCITKWHTRAGGRGGNAYLQRYPDGTRFIKLFQGDMMDSKFLVVKN